MRAKQSNLVQIAVAVHNVRAADTAASAIRERRETAHRVIRHALADRRSPPQDGQIRYLSVRDRYP